MNSNPSFDEKRGSNPFDWVAYQYVIGELEQSEVDLFEKSLADNLMAQQALADAVHLHQLAHAALRPSDRQVSESRAVYAVSAKGQTAWSRSSVGKMITGGLAMAILIGLVSGLSWWAAQRDFSGIGEVANQDHENEVADLWANSIVDASSVDNDLDLIDPEDADDESLTNVVNDLDSDEETGDPESAWLVDALKEFGAEPMTPSGNSM